MQQNARIGISSITDDFRHVSYGKDPTQPSVLFAGPDSIVFVADIYRDQRGGGHRLFPLAAAATRTRRTRTTRADEGRHGQRRARDLLAPQSYGILAHGLHLHYFNGAGTELASPVAAARADRRDLCCVDSGGRPEEVEAGPYSDL